jgi:hypothetical protein
MILKDILAISGEQGLFRFVAQSKNSIIVEHLESKKRSTVYGSAKVSSLEDIAIFTDKEDMPLGKVFDLIFEKENGGPAVNPKIDPEKLKSWFNDILPEYSKNKVYVSDIKKVALWYNILHSLNLLVKEEIKKEDLSEKTNDETTDSEKELAPVEKKKKKSSSKTKSE